MEGSSRCVLHQLSSVQGEVAVSWFSPSRPSPPLEDALVGDDFRKDPHGLLDLVFLDHHRPRYVVAGLVLEVAAAEGQGELNRSGG